MNIGLLSLVASGIGAGVMYLLDPDRGRRRRALVRDKLVHLETITEDAIGVVSRDLQHRAQGAVSLLTQPLRGEAVGEEKLVPRVRARLGRLVSHPHAIQVSAHQGVVTLKGPILAREVPGLLKGIRSVRGVRDIDNQLTVHERSGGEPSLQGQSWRPGMRWEWEQANWSPTFRLITGLLGGGLAVQGLRKNFLSRALGMAGLMLLVRALANTELPGVFGLRRAQAGIELQKTITIHAPVSTVFQFWRNLENFPRFMSHIKQIRQLDEQKSHWTVSGPAGLPLEWEAVTTKVEPNRLIAWQSLPGARVDNAGVVHFEEVDGGTRVHVQLVYNPPAGMIGHSVASIFGFDPKSDMDDDLARMKMIIENEHARLKMTGQRDLAA